MAQQIINVGAAANDGTGDNLRVSQQKANDNFTELYGMVGSDDTADHNKGTWNSFTNSPTLADGVGQIGDYYIVSSDGSQDLGSGSIAWAINDVISYDGAVWYKHVNNNQTGDQYFFVDYKIDGNQAVSSNWTSWPSNVANYDQSAFIGGSFGSGSTVTFSSAIAQAIPRSVPSGAKLHSLKINANLLSSSGTTSGLVEVHTNEQTPGNAKTTLYNNQLLVQDSWTFTANAVDEQENKTLTVLTHNAFTDDTMLFIFYKVTGSGGGTNELNFRAIYKL